LKDKVSVDGDRSGNSEDNDVIDALIALGYSNEEALKALRDMPASATTAKERIKHALKILGS
jgi:Holliday junction resolvasome RuvABC DNA-binding subunit